MFSISSKSRYGILAMLLLAERYGQGLMQIKDIAKQKDIPLQYLSQIFGQLVKADIVRSVRGKNGGYTLSRSPSAINLLQILEVLEGGLELIEKDMVSEDAVQELFSLAESRLKEIFAITLAELLSRQRVKEQILHYDI